MIPGFYDIVLPLLKIISDGKIWEDVDIYNKLVEYFKNDPQFKLTDEELNQIYQTVHGVMKVMKLLKHRVVSVKMWLKTASIVEIPQKGKVKITEKGLELLKQGTDRIDSSLLKQYVDFKGGFKPKEHKNLHEEIKIDNIEQLSPEEQLEFAYKLIKNRLKDEILQRLKDINPEAFERLIIDVLLKMGYGANIEEAGKVLGKSGDGGIDGIIKQDPLGLDNIYLQAKRWNEGTIGRPKIQEFVGALQGKGASKGVFITTSKFTQDAKNYAEDLSNTKVILIDGEELAELMIRYNVGVTTIRSLELKRIDNDYFEEYSDF